MALRCALVMRGHTNPFDVDESSSRLEVPGEPVPMPTLCVVLLIVIPGIAKEVVFEIILFVKSGVPLPVSSVVECAKSIYWLTAPAERISKPALPLPLLLHLKIYIQSRADMMNLPVATSRSLVKHTMV